MKNRRIIKIGLSLMIALMFLIPSGAVLADDKKDADNIIDTIAPHPTTEKKTELRPMYSIDEAGNPVIEMATTTDIIGFYLESCVGDTMYPVTADKVIPFESCYEPMFKMETLEAPSVYEPEIEIYKMNADEEFCLYQTSFEDNAANYMEWGQIDKDVNDAGGYYDGWAWSDARACGSDHSFKSTMYDEYKNMQDDVLYLKDCIDTTQDEFELCDGSIVEIDQVGKVSISFDIFVDGERNEDTWTYSNPAPLDYLQFGFYDCEQGLPYLGDTINYNGYPGPNGGPNLFVTSSDTVIDNDGDGPDSGIFWSTQVGLFDVEFGYDYRYLYDGETTYCTKIDGCPGWWHVEYETTNFPDIFGIFFEWRSDKERVFEGAYVDNVEIDITEDIGQKIYQGHSQEWLTQDEAGSHWFKFPLDWTNGIEVSVDFDENGVDQDSTYYLAICKIKTDDGHYMPIKEIPFEIGDIQECYTWITGVEDDYSHDPIADGGILKYPSDAHIQYCIENEGNVAMSNTEVTATGYKLEKETLFEDDFESMLNWVYFEEDYPLYKSDKFAFSGSSSLAFNQPETGMIVGGSGQVAVEYIGYSQSYFSMEGVDDAVLDLYWQAVLPEGATFSVCFLGYHYIIIGPELFAGPICQKSWIGPMQPQGMYSSVDMDYWFDLLVANDYMKDDNGHETYDTGIGFYLDTTDVNKEDFVPVCCFEPGETPWSGVYIDDVSVTATVKGKAVWSDSHIIPGPCEPGEKCCDQFTWEDVPYSCYIIEVTAPCAPSDDYDENEFTICVMEDLEQASKIDAVDYTECEPEGWCISNVVGNDCGNALDPVTGEFIGGTGDHYALATNCDTNTIPEDANTYVGLEYIDISHLDIAGMPPPPPGYCQPMIDDIETNGHGPFSSDYYPYRVYDNYDLGAATTIDHVSFYGLEAYGDDTFDGNYFNIGFYADASGTIGSEILDQEWLCSAADQTFIQTWLGYTIWNIEVTLPTPVSAPAIGWFSVQSAQYAHGNYADLAWIDGVGDAHAEQWYGGSPYAILDYDVAFCIGDTSAAAAKGEDCYIAFDDGFESIPFDANWDFNSGWLDSYYGSACEGVQWAYSWTAGDTISKDLTFGNSSGTLWFQYKAESETHPMDLEVYVDATLVYADYGYTHTDCQMATVDLTPFSDGGVHTISFVGMTSDFYGQILDDVVVEVCDYVGEPVPEGDAIWLNATIQVDIRSDMGGVILEVAGYEETEDGWCDGCEDEYACPAGVLAWEQVMEIDGNAPGICQNISVNLADYLNANDTHFCLRFRLDTDAISPFRDIPGIGFHLHEIAITNILYDEILDQTETFYEDFEDANFVNEESGMTWITDCVTFGTHWMNCDDFKFCLADDCPVVTPYECNTATLTGYDSYGDGWYGEYPIVPPTERFIDVYVNGVLVVDAFTLDQVSVDSVSFDICPGDQIVIDYYSPSGNTVYIGEESWELVDGFGTTLAADGPGPVLGTTMVNIPTETSEMDGRYPAEPIDEAMVWSTEIEDAYEAYLTAFWEYDIGAGAELSFELSADGGNNWFTIAFVEGPASHVHWAVDSTPFDLTPWAGNSLLIRVHLNNKGVDTDSDGVIDTWYDGYVCVDHIAIQGKQDLFPPTATVSLSGNSVGPGMYAGPVTVTITAVDDMKMGEIHYILDGSESVVSGSKATFTVSADGDHTVEYWAVDATGNEGAHGTVTFSIDNSPPTVSITAPEPGLYLLGNKLLSMSKVFIIGAFTAEAAADDAQGVAVVQFMLNGEVVGEDTTAPYSTYIAVKNMGGATLKAVAIDGVGNTAEDSLDITYYKFL